MKLFYVIIIASVFAGPFLSEAADFSTWFLSDKKFEFTPVGPASVLIEKSCSQSRLCESYKMATLPEKKHISSKEVSSRGGTSPGSLICREYLKDRAVILKDEKGNENAFCVLKDRSLIDLSALTRIFDIQ